MEKRAHIVFQKTLGAARTTLARPGVFHVLQNILRGSLAFILSYASILNGIAPFGVAVMAASKGEKRVYALVGAIAGYASMGGSRMVKYLAITVSVYLILLVFRQPRLAKMRFAAPFCAAGCTFLFGSFIFLTGGFMPETLAFFLCEVIVTFGATGLFAHYFTKSYQGKKNKAMNNVSALFVISAFFILCTPVTILGDVSVGRILATGFCLLVAIERGVEISCVYALSVGVAVSFASGNMSHIVIYGMCGLFSGCFSKVNRLACTLVYVLVSALGSFLLWQEAGNVNILYETFVASVLLSLFDRKLLRRILSFIEFEQTVDAGAEAFSFAAARFAFLSQSFKDVACHLELLLHPSDTGTFSKKEFTASLAGEVCGKCDYCAVCYQRNRYEITEEFNGFYQRVVKKGYCTEEDFSDEFLKRCRSPGYFYAQVNDALRMIRLRRQQAFKAREDRVLLQQQYKDIAALLEENALAFTEELTFDAELQYTVRRYLRLLGLTVSVKAVQLKSGKVKLVLTGDKIGKVFTEQPEVHEKLEKLLELQLCVVQGTDPDQITLTEPEAYTLVLGVASKRKNGQPVNGDSGGWVKCDDGHVYIILSDGMGSGGQAGAESRKVVQVLERLLQTGFSPSFAINLLEQAIRLSGLSLYVTVDILGCDLNTGEISIVKCGSAPTYLKRMQKVQRISGRSYPVGSFVKGHDTAEAQMGEGDTVVLLTDGVEESISEFAVRRIMEESEPCSTREMALSILKEAERYGGDSDDMTVLSVRLKRRVSA